MKNKNIISIHLKAFKTAEEFRALLSDNNITFLSPEAMEDAVKKGWKKVFIDKSTETVVAYLHSGSKTISFEEKFLNELNNMPSIGFSKSELTMDAVLDKINEYGMDSLSKREKEFLKVIR